jgi:formylglycine-generating enzyme required for sulfatase activity
MLLIISRYSMDELMIPVPGGKIELRDDRLKAKWTTPLEPFLMAKYPVTQELYFEITKAAPSTLFGKRKPVETVTWKDAVNFCDALSLREGLIPFYSVNTGEGEIPHDVDTSGYRLPTEAEWEYACKAGTTGIRYGELDKIAWYKENSQHTSHEVGLKEPNPWGLYDMLGNVWEWCSDIYDKTVYGSYRVMRGGGWNDDPRGCMATNRRRSHPSSFRIDDLGFRIARTVSGRC